MGFCQYDSGHDDIESWKSLIKLKMMGFTCRDIFWSTFLFKLSDPGENSVPGYFGYANFKNLISFALGRRVLELAILAWFCLSK